MKSSITKFSLIFLTVVLLISFWKVGSISEPKQPFGQQNFGEKHNCHNRQYLSFKHIQRCTFGQGGRAIYLVGDSVANQYSTVTRDIAGKLGYKLVLLTAPSCFVNSQYVAKINSPDNYLPPYDYSTEFIHCKKFSDIVLSKLKSVSKSDIVIFSFLDQYFWDKNIDFFDFNGQKLDKSKVIESSINDFKNTGGTKFIILPTPNFRLVNDGKWEPSACFAVEKITRKCGLKIDALSVLNYQKLIRNALTQVSKNRIQLIDPIKQLCESTCNQFDGSRWTFRDFTHLSEYGAAKMRQSILQGILKSEEFNVNFDY